MLGSEKEFVVTKAQTHGPGHGAVCPRSELSVIPLSYSAVKLVKMTWSYTNDKAIFPELLSIACSSIFDKNPIDCLKRMHCHKRSVESR